MGLIGSDLESNLPLGDYSSSHSPMAKAKKKPGSRNYAPEFIAKALSIVEKQRAEGQSMVSIAKQLGVPDQLLYTWKAKKEGRPYGSTRKTASAPPATPRKASTKAESPSQRAKPNSGEIQALKNEIAELKAERDLLKRTITVFARG